MSDMFLFLRTHQYQIASLSSTHRKSYIELIYAWEIQDWWSAIFSFPHKINTFCQPVRKLIAIKTWFLFLVFWKICWKIFSQCSILCFCAIASMLGGLWDAGKLHNQISNNIFQARGMKRWHSILFQYFMARLILMLKFNFSWKMFSAKNITSRPMARLSFRVSNRIGSCLPPSLSLSCHCNINSSCPWILEFNLWHSRKISYHHHYIWLKSIFEHVVIAQPYAGIIALLLYRSLLNAHNSE